MPLSLVVEITKPLAVVYSSTAVNGTETHGSFSLMDRKVFKLALNKNKVLYSVIVSFTVNVVNYLVSFQKSPKLFLHDNTVLQNVSVLAAIRMAPIQHNNVSSVCFASSLKVIKRLRILSQPCPPTRSTPFSVLISGWKSFTAIFTECWHMIVRIPNLSQHSNA